MSETGRRKRLSEKELGSLYLLSETPLLVDRIVQAGSIAEADIAAIHQSLSRHEPDMALIALALSGNLLAERMKASPDRQDLAVLGTELKYLSVNTVEEVGRIWIDACRYGVADEADIHDMVHQTGDILCMFTSLYMDIAEAATPEPEVVRALAACCMYQAEAQADRAAAMIEAREEGTVIQPDGTAGPLDHIPLPPELQDKTYENNVVTFTLFGERATH